ncbi:hypothetical protein [Desulfitibacter alkalitolerans]|uniref:hypothetical protein n=1 Tax=Desulfitibacter alkalitolerans TaxID=264641 RepID=UPI0004847C2F|nr:hypothetical protein [Desulfitibacter alkalitolerans]
MENSVLALFLQAIPEGIAFSVLVLAMNRDMKNWKEVVLVGVILALILHFIRMLPLSFGIHTLIFIGLAIITYNLVLKINFTTVVKAVLLGTLLVVVGEALSFLIIVKVMGFTFEELTSSAFLWIISGWVHIIIIFIVAYFLFKKGGREVV